ncbi:MAG: hypothetical protein ACLFQA_07450 [Bacteroidales bacterium]
MHDRLKYFLLIAQALIIAFLLVYLVFSIDDSRKVSELEEQVSELRGLNELCLTHNDSLSMVLQEFRINNALPPFLDKRQIEELQKRGLNDPVKEIRDDLVGNPDLISRSSVLGGRMDFYFRDGIHILNDRWVFAYFEDGHIDGALLLKYTIKENGSLAWEVLDETK